MRTLQAHRSIFFLWPEVRNNLSVESTGVLTLFTVPLLYNVSAVMRRGGESVCVEGLSRGLFQKEGKGESRHWTRVQVSLCGAVGALGRQSGPGEKADR